MDGDKFTTEQKDRFKADNDYYRGFIKAVEEQVNARFKAVSIPIWTDLLLGDVLLLTLCDH